LSIVDGQEALDRLEFQYDLILNDKVETKSTVQSLFLIDDRQCELTLKPQAGLPQLKAKTFLIDRFKQARPKVPMDLDCQSYDPFGERIHRWGRVFRAKRIHLSFSPSLRLCGEIS
jgi:hypothetical protein